MVSVQWFMDVWEAAKQERSIRVARGDSKVWL